MGCDPKTCLIKLILKLPGHGLAWHADNGDTFYKTFNDLPHDAPVHRKWWSIDDWRDGHVLQISRSIISHWQAGQVYDIPMGQPHASCNFGYQPQWSVSFTGVFE